MHVNACFADVCRRRPPRAILICVVRAEPLLDQHPARHLAAADIAAVCCGYGIFGLWRSGYCPRDLRRCFHSLSSLLSRSSPSGGQYWPS